MDAADSSPKPPPDKTDPQQWALTDAPASSARDSMYRLTGATRGTAVVATWECFIPFVMFWALKGLAGWLESVLRVNDGRSLHLTPRPDPTSFGAVVAEWSVRNVIVLASVAFFVIAFGALSTAWYAIFESLASRRAQWPVMVGIAVMGLAIFLEMFLTRQTGASAEMLDLQAIASHQLTADLQPLYALMYASGTTVLLWAACASCAVLLPDFCPDAVVTDEADIAFLRRRMRSMRAMLYMVGAFLAMSTVVNYTVTSTIAVSLAGEDQAAMQLMAGRSTLMFATLYSMILICMYAPTEAILRVRAMKVASNARVKLPERAAWLRERGLQLSAVGQFRPVLAVLSPILVGLFGQSVHALLKMIPS